MSSTFLNDDRAKIWQLINDHLKKKKDRHDFSHVQSMGKILFSLPSSSTALDFVLFNRQPARGGSCYTSFLSFNQQCIMDGCSLLYYLSGNHFPCCSHEYIDFLTAYTKLAEWPLQTSIVREVTTTIAIGCFVFFFLTGAKRKNNSHTLIPHEHSTQELDVNWFMHAAAVCTPDIFQAGDPSSSSSSMGFWTSLLALKARARFRLLALPCLVRWTSIDLPVSARWSLQTEHYVGENRKISRWSTSITAVAPA